MCGRFNQQQPDEKFANKGYKYHLGLKLPKLVANIAPGMEAIIITSGFEMQYAEFGFRPVWDIRKMFINARAEGKGNEQNLPEYVIGIDQMASFKKALQNNRCIIPVTSFIEGPEKEKLSKPFLIQFGDKKTIHLAGIYNSYVNNDGEEKLSFAIITTPANPICKEIGHHRSPAILHEDLLEFWLQEDLTQDDINSCLQNIYFEPDMEAIPLDAAKIKSGKLHEENILQPFGELITR